MVVRPSVILVCLVALLAFGPSCARSVARNECTDGIDNDHDGRFDVSDPGCQALLTAESPDPLIPECGDKVDNDGDGKFDLDDPGCFDNIDGDEFEIPPANCRDGIDNDGDGWTDWPNDPGCSLNIEDSEDDDCPGGPHCPLCANDKDDDGDGKADFPEDLGCDSAGDQDEFNSDPSLCGASVRVLPLAGPGTVSGSLLQTASNDLISPKCGGSGAETVYTFDLAAPRALRASTAFPETEIDTVLYVRGACREPATEIACNDDDPNQKGVSTLHVDRLAAGTHFLVVDAFRPNPSGIYKLSVEFFLGAGEVCVPGGEPCAPGFVCRKKTADAPEPTCEPPECRDAMDNDGDGLTDFPNEPGCNDREDNDELDSCPNGADCPQCGNTADDDQDGQIDLAKDPGCTHAADDFELDPCMPGVEAPELPFGLTTGTLTGTSQMNVSCPFGGFGPEDIFGLIIHRRFKQVTLSTLGSQMDTTIGVRFQNCGDAANQQCQNLSGGGETLTLHEPALGGYYVIVDSDFGTGNYQIVLQATVPRGEACDPADVNIVCEAGSFCSAETLLCEPAPCDNGNDDDGDGKIDWPQDPGCSSRNDDTEEDDCPAGANCPACANGQDDDADGVSDFKNDIGCAGAGDTDETDCASDPNPVIKLTGPVTQGSNQNQGANLSGSCGGNAGQDVVHAISFPGRLKELRVDTIGSAINTILYLRGDACDAADIACNDDDQSAPNQNSRLVVPNLDAGSYFLVVDTPFQFTQGNYRLNVLATVAAGEVCDDDQIASGIAVCESGFACRNGTCQIAACHDQVDNDGDGKIDHPDEPGCVSESDDDEADSCPGGADCPACSNQGDDDQDGQTDFPADQGCTHAADNLELNPCTADSPIQELTDAGDTGNTPAVGAPDHFDGSCNQFGNAPEVVYAYQQKRDLETLTFSTVGSSGDTVLYLRTGECSDPASEVDCVNEFGGGEEITLSSPAKDTFFVFIDGNFNNNIPYEIAVSGTLKAAAACDPASTNFVCAPGLFCGANAVCELSACNNGVDDDGDGKADANDPGCDSISDGSEEPDPAPVPACANGADDDNDGLIDFPNDLGCARASDTQEANCDGEQDSIDPVDVLGVTGTTTGASDDFAATPSCATTTAPDKVHEIFFPGALDNLTVDTFGSVFDTVLTVRMASCDGLELGCNDQAGGNQSEVVLGPQPAGLYMIIIDGFFSSQGNYVLNVQAAIKAGEACDPAQIAAGIATCPAGQSCTAGICQ
jgi:hypothetical protein